MTITLEMTWNPDINFQSFNYSNITIVLAFSKETNRVKNIVHSLTLISFNAKTLKEMPQTCK